MHAEEMAEEYPVVTTDTNALEAAHTLAEHRLPGHLVTDTSGQPYAVLPASQVVRFIVPTYVQDEPVTGGCDQRVDGRSRGGQTRRQEGQSDVAGTPHRRASGQRGRHNHRSRRDHGPAGSPLIAVMKDRKLLGVITASRLLDAALRHLGPDP